MEDVTIGSTADRAGLKIRDRLIMVSLHHNDFLLNSRTKKPIKLQIKFVSLTSLVC